MVVFLCLNPAQPAPGYSVIYNKPVQILEVYSRFPGKAIAHIIFDQLG